MDQPKKAFSSPRSVSNNFSVFARKGVYKRELNSIYNETIRNYDWSSSYGIEVHFLGMKLQRYQHFLD
ncbi:hypothetical protein ONA22_06565 [Mycoplasmopsis cynos]|nr:hypothetical protein [Mycoplasmopsis cynos]WAM03337.1 hypothetical protein ONA22_06565 [Mycoplasmopsis cynos]